MKSSAEVIAKTCQATTEIQKKGVREIAGKKISWELLKKNKYKGLLKHMDFGSRNLSHALPKKLRE